MAARKSIVVNGVTYVRADTIAPTPEKPATPMVATPATGKAESPFVAFLRERAQSKVPCGIAEHAGKCNRTFSPKSSGVTNHVARNS